MDALCFCDLHNHLVISSVLCCRPVTTASGRHVRLGTASMLTEPDGPFIDISKLNVAKYASKPDLAKVHNVLLTQPTHYYWGTRRDLNDLMSTVS